jgi:cyclase
LLTKRIIPCLDVKDGRVVKGVNFKGLRDAGDPVELAKLYYEQGADEITFLDISASKEGRGTLIDIVERTAAEVFVPLTVGGGVRSVEDVDALLRAGADKIGINSAAIKRPDVLNEISERFGKQVIVLSVDARRSNLTDSGFSVTTHGGSQDAQQINAVTGEAEYVDALGWVQEAEKRGAGEILLNSMDADGTKEGFDLEMINQVREVCSLPLIASGGAGKLSDFEVVATQTSADAFLAASVFHYGEVDIREAKRAVNP